MTINQPLKESQRLLTPWTNFVEAELNFPLKEFEKLLVELGWEDLSGWLQHWQEFGCIDLAPSFWPTDAKPDWLWGLGLPFLTDIERYLGDSNKKVLFGLSGLPGCGKTSFGRWLEAAADELGWRLTVISMDDFYLPASQLDEAMVGNPWNVPRALPGSHAIDMLQTKIDSWLQTGELLSPKFDKALRNGLGDRSGWRRSKPQVLIIEGWFLGCNISHQSLQDIVSNEQLNYPLTPFEASYREFIQKLLNNYQPIWKRFERIWHLKASDFNYTCCWKTQQERERQFKRGESLKGKALDSFIRMIQTSIPQNSLQSIDSDVVVELDKMRKIIWVGKNELKTLD